MHVSFIASLLVAGCLLGAPVPSQNPLPDQCWGVFGRGAQWDAAEVNRKTVPMIKGVTVSAHWQDLEPEPDGFRFDELIGKRLKAAAENDYNVYLVIYFSPSFPGWLEKNGVRLFQTEPGMGGNGSQHPTVWPYYLDERYKFYYYRALRKTGAYLRSLPKELTRRILYVECTEGSTGDPGPYKHNPLDSSFVITDEQWLEFRLAAWNVYREAYQSDGLNIPLLFKTNKATIKPEMEYIFKFSDVFGLKQGQGSHGYNMNGTQPELAAWREVNAEARRQGKIVFSRGEMDTIWFMCGWAAKYQPQFFYWSALFATHFDIDMWDMRFDACLSGKADAGIRFFNKYANERHDPARARHAFCAFRRGLDASDTTAFPEEVYGRAVASNVDRYLAIAEAYKKYGAVQNDPKQGASSSRMVSRRRKDFNDVGWQTERGNYCRFLTQIDPEGTSVAYWQKGPAGSLQGRFARGTDLAAGKDRMFFRFDDEFIGAASSGKLLLRVVYFDEGNGTWSLSFPSKNGLQKAIRSVNQDSGEWKEVTVVVDRSSLQRSGPRGADLVLTGENGDSVFHMIEVEKITG